MTIPANTWCSVCEESVAGNESICTTCGGPLEAPPSASASERPSYTGIRAVPEFMTEEFRQAGQEVQALLSNLRGQVHDIQGLTQVAMARPGEMWEEIPAALLAPQNDAHKGQPTSKETLQSIPRTVLEDQSSLFRQASLEVSCSTPNNLQFAAIPGEFGPMEATKIENATIIISDPKTGKGGLSEDTKKAISESENPLVYLERGDGVTFAKKALMAQVAGAIAVVIGNSMSTPWPYVMKDSSGEAEKGGLRIPVAMIKQADGKALVEYCKQNQSAGGISSVTATFKVQSLSKDCVVCCETFKAKDTVVTLPSCGHVFHETCAMTWLKSHNTCPFCRRELPAEDAEYEQQRRRTQRTHAGSENGNSEGQWGEFYG
mmetsp:Transcript_70898/g.205333  ORF Transcript_70898/g.205333 Transcript_70898/m.205333 type:complete len:375 (+) Transcript_70898:60-1184(+)